MRILSVLLFIVFSFAATSAHGEESAREITCRLVDEAADRHELPSSFLTRLIWRESTFRVGARSQAGAQGIAQFMPSTAKERGLIDPFDPETAIPASVAYISELRSRFGSLNLAAAAYNVGPNRVAQWRSGGTDLPAETHAHVFFITGGFLTRDADQAEDFDQNKITEANCLVTLASIRIEPQAEAESVLSGAIAPWGVQLVAGPNKGQALAGFQSLQRRFALVLAGHQPTILSTRLGGRGHRSYFRIRVAFSKRSLADDLCRRLRRAGAACLTVRN